MMVGLPGAGKSTAVGIIKERCEAAGRDTVITSSDEIRKMIYGDPKIQGDKNEVFRIMNRNAIHALQSGSDVIYDATNLSSKRRRGFLKAFSVFDCDMVCVICATPYDKCLERNRQRERSVPEDKILEMYRYWTTPFYNEGWDRIEIIYSDGAAGSLGTPVEFAESLLDFEQDNPHHLETLGTHLLDTRTAIVQKYGLDPESNTAIAALLHDCGKPFTKAFANSKGDRSEIAHYYRHENTGAYDALFFDYNDKTTADILEISFLIRNHMAPFFWKTPEDAEVTRENCGDELFGCIEMIHDADKSGSVSIMKDLSL